MERRLYFLCGDVVSNAGVGALVGLAVASCVGETRPVVLAMVLGGACAACCVAALAYCLVAFVL